MSTQKMLDDAIKHFGLNDLLTIMLSQKLDKEVVEEQRRRIADERVG